MGSCYCKGLTSTGHSKKSNRSKPNVNFISESYFKVHHTCAGIVYAVA